MSGHSKWSTIKRKKGANDQARGKMFSKLARAISLAAKEGPNPDLNNKLRVAVEAAKSANMPKDTIDRAIKKASESKDLMEVYYEGFGPEGIQILIEAATDNKNRTSSELKSILQKHGGNMGSPGSVSFNFTQKGFVLVENPQDADQLMLELIDLGASEMEQSDDGLEIYCEPGQYSQLKSALDERGVQVADSGLMQSPQTMVEVKDKRLQEKIGKLMQALDDHDDVQNVYTNADI